MLTLKDEIESKKDSFHTIFSSFKHKFNDYTEFF
jgi:hypothetical protein